MRLMAILSLLVTVCLPANATYSQNSVVKLNMKNASLVDIFREIEKQSEYRFFYKNAVLDSDRKIDLNTGEMVLTTVLDQLLDAAGLEYKMVNQYIVITPGYRPKTSETPQAPAQKTVTGRVVDENGAPVAGAIIAEQGVSNAVVTDGEGNFSFRVSENAVISVSQLGYLTRTISTASQSTSNIVLVEDTQMLDEVVVVGYGTQKKVSVTGAVGVIRNESVNRLANSTTASLQGVSPGLTILDKGGSPGRSETTLRIRGTTTINNSDALLLVDGVEQRISDLNPDDIESISILKDASTTAIYGSRAANGVVLVTTKRGGEGKVKVNFNAYWGLQNVTNKTEHMETVTYMRQQNQAFLNNNQAARYSETFIQEWIDNHKSDPVTYRKANQWQDAMYHSALQQNYSVIASGGNDKARGLLSLRYYDQEGVITNFNSNLKEIRTNIDFQPFERLKISTDMNFRSRFSTSPPDAYAYDVNGGGIFYAMYHATQFVVPRYEDGSYGLGNKNANPLMLAEMSGYENQTNNLLVANVRAELDIIGGLKFSAQYARRYAFNKNVIFKNKYRVVDNNFLDWGATARNEAYNPNVNRARTRDIARNEMDDRRDDLDEYTLNLLLNYTKQFGKHGLSILGGFSQIENKWSQNQAFRQDFYNNDVQSINMGSESTWKSWGYNNEYALQSYFGRVNYNFDDRYLLEANLRYDGTSRFTGGNQYGFFPSFSAGWRISNEAFWGDGLRTIVSDLKLRGSWGKTGNQTAGLYAFYESYNSTTYNFGGNTAQGYMQTALANRELKWEVSTQTGIGVDIAFLKNRLNVSADYYKKRTDGILVNLPIAGTIGLDAPVQNAAIVDNEGFELSLDWRDRAGDFSYGAHFNISNNKNEVISLGGANPTVTGGLSDDVRTVREGYPVNAYWGYKTGGLLTQADIDANYPRYDSRMTAGDVKYLDRDDSGTIDAEDMTVIGDEFPRFPFAFSANMAWKNFDFSFMFQGVMKADVRVSGALAEAGNFEGFALDIAKDYWTPENLDARFPRPRKSVDFNAMMSDYWVMDAAYLRLKNVQLGYTIPSELTRKWSIERLRVYLAGSNLLTFSPIKEWGLDPEFKAGRFLYYPQTSVFTVGVNLTF